MNPGDIVVIDDIGLMHSDIHAPTVGSNNMGIVIEQENIPIHDKKSIIMAKGWRVLVNGVDAVFFEEDLIIVESKNEYIE
jgi:hypothetical protein